MLCVVGPGTSFGEGILTGKPHSVTVVTKDTTELIRVELKDFKLLWEVGTPSCMRIILSHTAVSQYVRYVGSYVGGHKLNEGFTV